MKNRPALAMVMWLLIFSPVLFSQSINTGAIQGTVCGPDGHPLSGVIVTASSPGLMGVRTFIFQEGHDAGKQSRAVYGDGGMFSMPLRSRRCRADSR